MSKNFYGFMGYDSSVWFQGVVEDRLDPLKLGRVRIRILGLYTEDKTKIPSDELPWAYPIQPITSASMNGLGEAPVGPVEGTWIVGFFRDGENCQEPVIFGTLAGIPQEYPYPKCKKIGFLDPRSDLSARPRKYKKKQYPNDGTGAVLENEVPTEPTGESYPRTSHPWGCVVGESDINRLARNENIGNTIVKLKRDSIETNIPMADGGTWDEPPTPYNASYPHNSVEESESGHIIEADNTVGTERTHVYHKSGTFQEVYPDGIKVEKIVGNNYKIVLEEQYEHIQNRYNLTIDGPFNILVQNDATIVVKGNADIKVGKDLNTTVGGDYHLAVKGNLIIESEGDATFQSEQTTTIGSENDIVLSGNSVSSFPPVDECEQAGVAISIGGQMYNGPEPVSVNVPDVDDNTLDRDYPRPVPIYEGIMEAFGPVEDNFSPATPETAAYTQNLISSGLVATPPTPQALQGATQMAQTATPTTVGATGCEGFNYSDQNYPSPQLDSIQLSPNWKLGEVYTHHNIIQPQNGLTVNQILCNIKHVTNYVLEALTAHYGKGNLTITSGFRNLGTPNSPTSQHPNGEALDIQFKNSYSSMKDKEKYHYDIANEILANKIVPSFDQMILECPGTYGPWVHMSFATTSKGGPSGKQRGVVNTWFGAGYLSGLVLRP